MALKPKTAPRRRRSFAPGRRQGLDLQWTPPKSRYSVHDRRSRRSERWTP